MFSKLPEFFEQLEENQKNFGIEHIQLSMTTLEEVFIHISELEEQAVANRKGEENKKKCFCY